VELELVASVLSDPNRGVALAARETITCGLFDCDDVRLIFAAALVACDRGKLAILRLARLALRREGWWDANARAFERNGRWSDTSLANLACAHPCPAMTITLARELLDLCKRMARVVACWREMKAAMVIDESCVT
jgi:hypothetical protein